MPEPLKGRAQMNRAVLAPIRTLTVGHGITPCRPKSDPPRGVGSALGFVGFHHRSGITPNPASSFSCGS